MVDFPALEPKETPKAPEQALVEQEKVEEGQEGQEVQEGREGSEEREEQAIGNGQEAEVVQPQVVPVAQLQTVVTKDPTAQKIESILEEDLTDLYLSMPKEAQVKFKYEGEKTLSKIMQLVSKTKVNAKKIFLLIREWLKIIPGVNRFFLEQEAKIKTDKILRM